MKRILHISDLHFGRIHPPAIKSLEDFLGKQENHVDLIIMTGDWTQRARRNQYRAASEFITRAKVPVLTIPGNHDIPLYNFLARLLQPLRHYNRYVGNVTVDSFNDPEVAIVGFQTANQFRTVEGRILEKDIQRAQDLFSQAPADAVRIIACHHPIFEPHHISKIKPRHLVDAVLDLKPDIVLSGHSHLTWIEQVETNQHKILHISAGSATSNRLRGEVNSFHIIETHSRQVVVETFYLSEDGFILKKDQVKTTVDLKSN